MISVRAMHNDFVDSTHVEYDISVRKLAETIGFKAFSQNAGMSVKHYGAQNMRTSKSSYPKRFTDRFSDQRKTCFHWNKEFGCPKTEEECGYPHACSKCFIKTHKRSECRKDIIVLANDDIVGRTGGSVNSPCYESEVTALYTNSKLDNTRQSNASNSIQITAVRRKHRRHV